VGGYNYDTEDIDFSDVRLKSVECYHPSLDKWTPVAGMSELTL